MDECSEPLTAVDPVMEVDVLGHSGGPDGEVHGHISDDDATEAGDTPHDIEMISQFSDTDSETDHEEGMMLGEPEPELEPKLPNQEPECEDNVCSLKAYELRPVLVGDSSGMSSDTELMPGTAAGSVDESVDFGSDTDLMEDVAVGSADGGLNEEGSCEGPSEKRRRLD